MFARFNLRLSMDDIPSDEYFNTGSDAYSCSEESVRDSLNQYVQESPFLSAEKLADSWFPQVKANVFLSHSHENEELAQGVAGWLWSEFGIKTFIDSSVWGYADELLNMIDRKYAFKHQKNNGGVSYDYNIRNLTTSHVHMLLNGALMQMIDHTECIIFLNTPNAIKFRNSKYEGFTESPWLYSELLISEMIEKKSLAAYRRKTIEEAMHNDEKPHMEYKVSLKDFYDLGKDDLEKLGRKKYQSATDALDELYRSKGCIKETIYTGRMGVGEE